MDEDYRRLQIQQEKIKTKEQRKQEALKAAKLDLNDLRARARVHSRTASSAKISISHLGRVSKNAKMYKNNRQFQLMYDFEGLTKEIETEKNYVYVLPESYKMLQNAKDMNEIKHQAAINPKHSYVSLD